MLVRYGHPYNKMSIECRKMVNMPPQYFGGASSFSILGQAPSSRATVDAIRPGLRSTFARKQRGGGRLLRTRKTLKQKGGFSPSIMGAFAENAAAVVVPIALFLGYQLTNKGKGKKQITSIKKRINGIMTRTMKALKGRK